jgi:NADH-quinone oxidoreductase subunit C
MSDTPPSVAEDPLLAELREAFGEAIAVLDPGPADLALAVPHERAAEILAALKHRHRFGSLVDLCGVDDPRAEPPLRVVYILYSFRENRRIRLEIGAGDGQSVPSAVPFWPAAAWLEREAYDLLGLRFDGHPELGRLLLWEGFDGHPLRKAFPLEGRASGAALYPDYFEVEPL